MAEPTQEQPAKGVCVVRWDPKGLPDHMQTMNLHGHIFGAGEASLPDELAYGLLRDYPDHVRVVSGRPRKPELRPPGTVPHAVR